MFEVIKHAVKWRYWDLASNIVSRPGSFHKSKREGKGVHILDFIFAAGGAIISVGLFYFWSWRSGGEWEWTVGELGGEEGDGVESKRWEEWEEEWIATGTEGGDCQASADA
jgi:hypothetical protein